MKLIKNNLLGIIIGGIIFGSVGITIAYQINASQISYNNSDTSVNVSQAITDLYNLSTTHCPDGTACNKEKITLSSNLKIYPATYQGIVYLDPANLSIECNENNSRSETGIKRGCMKFYVYNQDSNYYYAILDHNTTSMVNTDCNGNCWAKAQEVVKEDTASWTAVQYGENDERNPRNISAMEVYKITESTNNQTNWQVNGLTGFYLNAKNGNNGQGYGWLFDRTNGCTSYGCTTADPSTYGYWTSDVRDFSYAWNVNFLGTMGHYSLADAGDGVRPVITIAK